MHLKIQTDVDKSKGQEAPEPDAKTEVQTQTASVPKKIEEAAHEGTRSEDQSEADELNGLIELERKGGHMVEP